MRILSEESTTLSGLKAEKLTYSGSQGGFKLKWMQVYTIKNNRAYILTYTAQEASFNKYKEYAQKMFDTFRFI